MTYPQISLRFAFGSRPFDAVVAPYTQGVIQSGARFATLANLSSDGWTTISSNVIRSIEYRTGKESALDEVQPGTLSILVDNTDRSFDPLYSDGPYYQKLIPGTRVQLAATLDGVEYEQFNGFLTGVTVKYGNSSAGTATIAVTDAVKYLRRKLDLDPYASATKLLYPFAYYRLGEKAGNMLTDSSGNGHHGKWLGPDLSVSKAQGLLAASNGALELKNGGVGVIPMAAIPALRPLTIEFWFKADKPPVSGAWGDFAQLIEGGGLSVGVASATYNSGLNPGGLKVQLSGGGFTGIAKTFLGSTNTNVCDGNAHHILITYSPLGSFLRIFIDGVDRTAAMTITGDISGGLSADLNVNYIPAWNGSAVIDELAFFPAYFARSDAAQRWADGASPWDGDTTGERVAHVLEAVDWPTGMSNVATGSLRLGVASWDESTDAAEYLAKITASEQGELLIAHWDYGRVEFRDRSWASSDSHATTVQAVFTDSDDPDMIGLIGVSPGPVLGGMPPTSPRVRYESLDLVYDEALVVRQVSVEWAGGTVTVTDPTATSSDPVKSETVKTILETEADARALADWVLSRYSEVFARVRSVTIRPTAFNGDLEDLTWYKALSLREGDRVMIERTPGGVGARFQFEVLIEGKTTRIADGVNQWETTYYCSPVDALATSYGRWDYSSFDAANSLFGY